MVETLQKQGILISEIKEINIKKEVSEQKEELYNGEKVMKPF